MLAAFNWQKYALIAGTLVLLFGTGYLKGCTDEREKSAAFRAKVEAAAQAAEIENARIERAWLEVLNAKEKAHATAVARLTADANRLRDNARRSVVPTAPEGTRRPDLACFDRTELDRALGDYRGAIAELAGEGAKSALDLDFARAWWQEVSRIQPRH